MTTDRPTLPGRRALSSWLITLAATAASTYALDAVATAAGVLLVASQLLSGLDHLLVLAFLAATYVLWGVTLRANLGANWSLLDRTGTSTNALSKAAFELTRRRGARAQRIAAAAGYVATEIAKEAPYFTDAMKDAAVGEAVLVFGTGPTLHHVFLAAPKASEIHLADYLPANDLRHVLAPGFSPRVQVCEPQGHEAQGYSSVVLARARRREDPARARRRESPVRGLRSGIRISGSRSR